MKEIVIVASKQDPAGFNIADRLIERYGFKETEEVFEGNPIFLKQNLKLAYTSREIIFADHLDFEFNPYCYVFVSKHKSESGKPSLSAHFPGNFSNDNSYGGRPRELALTFPSFHKEYMMRIWSAARGLKEYQVVTEPMHHGPTSLRRPVVFVEIGSNEAQWRDDRAVDVTCKALMETLNSNLAYRRIAVGFGGVHYSSKFTDFLVGSEYALGAIASKYALPHLDASLMEQMKNKCVEEVKYAALDWKGLGKEKEKVLKLVEDAGLVTVKV